jgi:hypothetical protein
MSASSTQVVALAFPLTNQRTYNPPLNARDDCLKGGKS